MNVPDQWRKNRESVEQVLNDIELIAVESRNNALLVTVRALRKVHDLYPETDELRMRGTPQHTARVDIHNSIVESLETLLSALQENTEPATRPSGNVNILGVDNTEQLG